MDKDSIAVITNPQEVAKLMDPNSVPINEFEKTLVEIEADKKKRDQQTQELLKAQEKTKPSPQPLQLTYKFIGIDTAGHEPITLMINTEVGYFATAYCLAESKQLASIKVDKLPIPEPARLPEVVKTAPIQEHGIMFPEKPKKEKK